MNSIDLTPILQALIGLLAAILTYKVIPWIQAKTTNEQQALLSATVKTLVYAAEQVYGAGKGDEKLAYVKKQLEVRGFSVDVDEIEAAVRKLANQETKLVLKEQAEVAGISQTVTLL